MKSEHSSLKPSNRNHQRFLETLLDTLPMPVFYRDTRGVYIGCNQAFAQLFCLVKEDITGQSVFELWPEDLAIVYTESDQPLLQSPGTTTIETQILVADGVRRQVVMHKASYCDDSGSVAGVIGVFVDIEDIREREATLKETGQRLANIIDFLPDATFAKDLDGKIIAWNKAAEDMTGFCSENMLGKGDYEYSLPFSGVRRPILIDLVLQPDNEIEAEYDFLERNGNELVGEVGTVLANGQSTYLWGKATPLYDSLGQVIGAIESIRDITTRKAMENAIKTSEAQLRLITDNMSDLIVQTDVQGIVTYASPTYKTVLGYEVNDILGTSVFNRIHPDDVDNMMQAFHEGIKSVNPVKIIFRTMQSTGTHIWMESSARPLIDDQGAVYGAVVTTHDISELHKAVTALGEREEEYRELFDNTSDLIYTRDYNGNFISVNQAMIKTLGYNRGELAQMNETHIVAPEQHGMLAQMSQLGNGSPSKYEIDFITKDGRLLSMELNTHITSKDGKPLLFQGIARDITIRKQAEQELAAEKERLAVTLSSIGDGVITTDTEGRVTLMNKAAEEITGWTQEEVQDRGLPNVLTFEGQDFKDDDHFWQQFIKNVREGSSSQQLTMIARDGTRKIISNRGALITDKDRKIIGYVNVFRDITEQKKKEALVALSQKLESIGQLAAGIAHEINTPMQYIGDNTQFLREAFQDITDIIGQYRELGKSLNNQTDVESIASQLRDMENGSDIDYLIQEIPTALQQSLDGINHVSKLVHAMKNFAHPGQTSKQLADLNQHIEGTVTISRNEWKYIADLELSLDPRVPRIHCVIDEINQVVLNMIINSTHAIDEAIKKGFCDRGKIIIETRQAGSYVEIIINDNGIGIPQNIIGRIYDPFFTTKEVGKGTGQGLAIAHDIIVNKHNGRILAESEPGIGTTFIIQLPIEG